MLGLAAMMASCSKDEADEPGSNVTPLPVECEPISEDEYMLTLSGDDSTHLDYTYMLDMTSTSKHGISVEQSEEYPWTFSAYPYAAYFNLTQTDANHYVLKIHDTPSNGYQNIILEFSKNTSSGCLYLFSIDYQDGKWTPDMSGNQSE